MTRDMSGRRLPARNVALSLFAVGSVSLAALLPSACETGGIGDPCIPEEEYFGSFSGFQVSQENIESRSFQCETRICLVNHFQGRVSCPLGQPNPADVGRLCTSMGDACDSDKEACTVSDTFGNNCDDATPCPDGFECDVNGFCRCTDDSPCPTNYFCDNDREGATNQCVLAVCHDEENCQDANATPEQNAGKVCCLPGTFTPVGTGVCGECAEKGFRNAKNSVYCSCRCGVAEGQPEDDNFNFCECPDGFECAEVRPNLGLGDEQLTGKYCVKKDDPIISNGKIDPAAAATECGSVQGQTGTGCEGNPI